MISVTGVSQYDRLAKDLPEFGHRKSKITLVCGSFKDSMDLGGLARQIQKTANAHAAAQAKSA